MRSFLAMLLLSASPAWAANYATSGAECTAKKAGETRINQAANMVGMACRKLYDESEIERFLNSTPQPH